MEFGFPQCSIMGPIGYSMYTNPVDKILRDNNISYHVYADDTQLYVTFDPRTPGAYDAAMNKLQTCFAQIKDWMLCNKLQLYQSKTDFLSHLHLDPPLNFIMSTYNSVILE